METYVECAKHLDELLAGARAVRITVRGYLPLLVEEIGTIRDGHRLVSLCQYGEQNGDLMRDCDLVFMVTDLSDGAAAEPVSFVTTTWGFRKKCIGMTRRAGVPTSCPP